MSYKRVVKKNGKSYGPYVYESYRDADGKVRKRYLGRAPKKDKKFLFSFFLLAVFVVLIFFVSSYTTEKFKSPQIIFPTLDNFLSFSSNSHSLITGFAVSDDSGEDSSGGGGSSSGDGDSGGGSSDSSGETSSSSESSGSSDSVEGSGSSESEGSFSAPAGEGSASAGEESDSGSSSVSSEAGFDSSVEISEDSVSDSESGGDSGEVSGVEDSVQESFEISETANGDVVQESEEEIVIEGSGDTETVENFDSSVGDLEETSGLGNSEGDVLDSVIEPTEEEIIVVEGSGSEGSGGGSYEFEDGGNGTNETEGNLENLTDEKNISSVNETELDGTDNFNETAHIGVGGFENETNETFSNYTEFEDLENLTVENETNETEFYFNETLNETIFNETNFSVLNKTIFNETNLSLLNESNLSLQNETLNETLENITQEDILEFTTLHYKAVIGRPVKWIKPVVPEQDNSSNGTIIVELPKVAENISVLVGEEVKEALEEVEEYEDVVEEADREEEIVGGLLTGNVIADVGASRNIFSKFFEWLRGFTISGNVVKVDEEQISREIVDGEEAVIVEINESVGGLSLSNGSVGELAVEYYTPAPEAVEEELPNGKRITITADDELNYTDILAYMLVDEYKVPMGSDRVRFYWYVDSGSYNANESNNSAKSAGLLTGRAILGRDNFVNKNLPRKKRVLADYVAQDFDGDGYMDYIEWTVPHLSSQTYDFIIEITGAEHLDENREFISDIYNETYLLDGKWSEPIYENEYVRVTFETNLTSERDITIFARGDVNESNVSVEVYLENGSEVVASFPIINEPNYYKIYLTNLSEPADVFDLKVVSLGSLNYSNYSISFDYIVDPLFGSSNISFVDPTPANDSSIYPTDPLEINISITDAPTLDSLTYYWNDTSIKIFSSDVLVMYNFNNFSSLGENDTYVNDTSGNGNRAIVYAGAVFNSTGGKSLGAFEFDGTDDFICPEDNGLCDSADTSTIFEGAFSERTYSFWFKANDITSRQVLHEEGDGAGFGIGGLNFFIEGGNVVSGIWELNDFNANPTWSNASISKDTWHHVVWTLNTSNYVNYYLDGDLKASFDYGVSMRSRPAAPGIGRQSDESRYFGVADTSGDTNYFNGTLDEFTVYGRALSAEEVNLLYMMDFYRKDLDNWTLYVNQTTTAGTQWIDAGTYIYSAVANDSSSNQNSTGNRTITVIGTPGVSWKSPTPDNNSVITNRFFEINVSINNSRYLDSVEFGFDGTNYSLINKSLVIFNFDNVSSLGENDSYYVDMSGNGNDGTEISGVTMVPGKYGLAVNFSNGWVCLDLGGVCDDSDSNPIYDDGYKKRTYSMWVYPISVSNNQIIMDIGNSTNGEVVYVASTGDLAAGVSTKGAGAYHSISISANSWHHVAITYDSSSVFKIYFDGVLAGSNNTFGYARLPSDDPSALGMAKKSTRTGLGVISSDGYNYHGKIDEFFVFNDTLSDEEIYHLYASSVHKAGFDDWEIYMNKSKNATDLLDYGTHTYDMYVENSYLEGGRVAGERTISVGGDCSFTADFTLSNDLVCSDNLTIVDGVTLSNDGYDIKVGGYAKVSGVLNLTSTSGAVLNFSGSPGGFYIGNNGTLEVQGASDSARVNITGVSGWNMDTAMNITTLYANFEFMNWFRSNLTGNDFLDIRNTTFRNGTQSYVVYINASNVSRFDGNSIYTTSANSQGLYWDSDGTLLAFENLVIEGPSKIIEVNDERLELNDSNFDNVNLTNNDLASVFSRNHNDNSEVYFIWPGNGSLRSSALPLISNKDAELNISKDVDLKPINFVYDSTDWYVDLWHMPAYGQSSKKEDYILYFEPGSIFKFDADDEFGQDSQTGFVDYSSAKGDTKLTMYLNGSGWGSGNEIKIRSSVYIKKVPFISWSGIYENWEVGGKRQYLSLIRGKDWWETGEGKVSVLDSIYISDVIGQDSSGKNTSFGFINVSKEITNFEVNATKGIWFKGSNHTITNLTMRKPYVQTFSLYIENYTSATNQVLNHLVNSSFDGDSFSKIQWADDGTNKSIVSLNHNDVVGDYAIAIKDDGPSSEQYLRLSEITNPDFAILGSYNVTLFSGSFIVDQDFNVTAFNLTSGSNENISLEVLNDTDFNVDFFDRVDGSPTFILGNGSFSNYQKSHMLINFLNSSGFDETAGPNVSYSNATGAVIEAFNSVDGGNNYRWRFNQTVITISPDNDTYIGWNVSENITFQCNVTNFFDLVNVSFFHDYSGLMERNQTASITGNSNSSSFNLTGLRSEKYLNWYCEVCDLFECENSSFYRNPVDTDNQVVDINATDVTNRTLENLSCFTTINDFDGNDVVVDVKWYKDGALNLSQSFSAVANGTLFISNLTSGNTTKHENWTCAMRFNNTNITSEWVNSSGYVYIENSPPVVTLGFTNPPSFTEDRTPFFNWTVSDDDGDTSFTYDWNLTAPAGCSDNRIVSELGDPPGYTPTSDLLCVGDSEKYGWAVRANDSDDMGDYPPISVFYIKPSIIVSLDRNVSFGSIAGLTGTSNSTVDNSPRPFTLQNDGNVFVNVSINATALWNTQPTASSYYRYKIDNSEPNSFNFISSVTDWANMPIGSATDMAIVELNYTNASDTAEVDIYVEYPPDENSGSRESIVTFTVSLGE